MANAAPTPKAVALVLAPALVLMLAFAFFYVGAFHEPTPHHVAVAVVGPPATAGQLNRLPGDPLDARPASSRPAALSQIDDREVYGAYEASTNRLFVASAANRATAVAWYTVTRYVRGTVIVAAIDAVGIGVALAVIDVPFALPLGLLVFVASAVPYVGATVSGTVAVLVALAANGPVDALLVLAAVIAVQQLEGNLLEPLIVGRQVRLHPVAVVTAVFGGSLTAGLAGAVIAVPLVAVVYRVYRVLRDDSTGDSTDGTASPVAGSKK